MSALKKLASQTATYGLSSIVGRLLNYLLVPVYVRTLSVYDNGVMTNVYAYVTFLLILFTYGLETGFFRFANKPELDDKRVYSTALTTIVGSSILFSLVMVAFSGPVAAWIDYPRHPEYVIYFAAILGLDAISSIPFVWLRYQNKALKFVSGKLLSIGVNIFFVLFFLVLCPYLLKNDPENFLLNLYNPGIGVGYVFISNLVASVVTLLFLYKELYFGIGGMDKKILKSMMIYSIPLMFAGLAGTVNESFSRIILQKELPFSPTENTIQLGIFGNVFKLAIFMQLAIQTFRMASEPFFFSMYKQVDARMVYARVMNYFVIICCLIFLTVTLYLDIIKHILKPVYFEGLVVVPILLLAYLFLGIYQNLSIWFKLADKTRFGLYFTIFGALITIILNYALIPVYGYTGSAIATLICYVSMAVVCYLVGQKYYSVPYNLKRITAYLFFTLALYVAGDFIRLFIFNPVTAPWFFSMTFLIGIFIIVVFIAEKRNLRIKNVASQNY
ncbi:MAG: polysaccharide biosynthesis C-terminal domain-containing protein [Flavobacterium sp.]|nr:polysaccharide biosynthesis C-terminal domain-containing protein [Pedobacter sp.]